MKFKELSNNLYIPEEHALALYIIRPNFEHGPWIAGGAVRSWLLRDGSLADIDVFVKNQNQISPIVERLKEYEFIHRFDSGNAISFSKTFFKLENDNDNGVFEHELVIQLIKRKYYDDPFSVVDDFDLAQSQLITDGDIVYGNERWSQKHLHFEYLNEQTVLKRLSKYSSYGYKIPTGFMEKLADNENINYNFAGDADYDWT